VYGEALIRDNKVRYVDGAFDASYSGRGIEVNGAKNLLLRNNVVECAPANPLRSQRGGSVSYFNNKTPAGVLLEGLNLDTGFKYEELETEADFALIMSLFNRRKG